MMPLVGSIRLTKWSLSSTFWRKEKKAKNHLAASAMYPHMYPSYNLKYKYSINTDG